MSEALTLSPNVIAGHTGGLWLVIATSNIVVVSGAVGALVCGVTATVGSFGRQFSSWIWSAGMARSSNTASSITPSNRRSEPSLPISSGPGPGGMLPATARIATCWPST